MKLAKGLKITDLRVGEGREVALQDIVHVHCTCRLSKGEVAFTTREEAPYQVRVAARNTFVALDQGLIGMRVGGLRQIKVPPHLTYYERKAYPNLPEAAVLIYEIELIRVPEHWDNTLHIRESPLYSGETKALERQWRSLEPSTDPLSEFQRVQEALFSHAQRDYDRHTRTKPNAPPNDGPARPSGDSGATEGPPSVS
ncbi:MAG: FKBP-type peptidyl-prolyl cis-trans isomerase [Verrucomicrobia bacterium]|nr:FKBP-type peptidyl-prolyl cis-trans isomerase [Verrucomicrobiota bacterium]